MKGANVSIKQLLREIVGIDNLPMAVLGSVVSVDEDDKTCVVDPIGEGANYQDVRLMADPSGSGMYFKPVVGSVVMIAPQSDTAWYVAMYSEIEEVWLRGEEFEGLVKVMSLVTKLNNLENKVNDIVAAFNTHVHPGVTTGAGSTLVSAAPIVGTLTPTQQNDIENPNVKHG